MASVVPDPGLPRLAHVCSSPHSFVDPSATCSPLLSSPPCSFLPPTFQAHATSLPLHVLVLRVGGPAGRRRRAVHAGGPAPWGPAHRKRRHDAVVPDDLGLPLQGPYDQRGAEVKLRVPGDMGLSLGPPPPLTEACVTFAFGIRQHPVGVALSHFFSLPYDQVPAEKKRGREEERETNTEERLG